MQGTILLIFRRAFKEVKQVLYDTTVGKVKHHKLPDVLNKYLFIDLFIFIYNFEKNHEDFGNKRCICKYLCRFKPI